MNKRGDSTLKECLLNRVALKGWTEEFVLSPKDYENQQCFYLEK